MGDQDRTRRALIQSGASLGLAAATGLLAPGAALAQTSELPPSDPAYIGDEHIRDRVTAGVCLAGGRELTFAIDSAANSSVLAEDLLDETPHRRIGRVVMHTLVGPESAEAIIVPRMQSGAVDVDDVRLAIGSREGLNGLDGLMGADVLADRKLVLKFGRGIVTRIERSRSLAPGRLRIQDPRNYLTVPVEARFSSLVMIRALFGADEGRAIIDSGASMTMINTVAARVAGVTPLATTTGETVTSIQSPTGATTPAQLGLLPSLSFADAHVSRLPVLVGDFHTFGEWGLADTPAGLLGLDVLSLFETVSIDLRRRELRVTA
jgi:hypothetical protein